MSIQRILIVDDEEITRKCIRTRLEKEQFLCFELSNGIGILKAIEEHDIDLLITDIVMDEKDGFEVFEEITASKGSSFPVIAMSSTSTYLLMAEYLGASAIFQKPVDLDALVDKVLSIQ